MKVSELKLNTVYVGKDGKERLLVSRSFDRRAIIFQKDADLVDYRPVENGVVSSQERCFITAKAFARWAVSEKGEKRGEE